MEKNITNYLHSRRCELEKFPEVREYIEVIGLLKEEPVVSPLVLEEVKVEEAAEAGAPADLEEYPKYHAAKEAKIKETLDFITEKGEAKIEELQIALNYGPSSIFGYLNILQDRNQIRIDGKKGSRKYVIIAPRPASLQKTIMVIDDLYSYLCVRKTVKRKELVDHFKLTEGGLTGGMIDSRLEKLVEENKITKQGWGLYAVVEANIPKAEA